MEFNPGIILATVVNFLILFFGLKYFFFEKVKLIVEARENEIANKLDSADEELEKARTLAINNERELQRAREEGRAITERHKKKAEKVYDEIFEESKTEAGLIIERAKIEIEREKEKAEYALKKEAIDLALDLSRKVIEKNIDEEKNRQLIDEFISEVGN